MGKWVLKHGQPSHVRGSGGHVLHPGWRVDRGLGLAGSAMARPMARLMSSHSGQAPPVNPLPPALPFSNHGVPQLFETVVLQKTIAWSLSRPRRNRCWMGRPTTGFHPM